MVPMPPMACARSMRESIRRKIHKGKGANPIEILSKWIASAPAWCYTTWSYMRIFVETWIFTRRLPDHLDDQALRALQFELAINPGKGAVMPGCAGLRKVRVADPWRGKGKRGGARVIYLDIPEAERLDFMTIYGKDEQDNLTPEQRRLLAELARKARAEAPAMARRVHRRR